MTLNREEAVLVRRARKHLRIWPYVRWFNVAYGVGLVIIAFSLSSLGLSSLQISGLATLMFAFTGLTALVTTFAEWHAESKDLLLRLVEFANLDPDR